MTDAAPSEPWNTMRDRLRRPVGERPPPPPAVRYCLTEADLDAGIPPEYHGATLLPRLVAILRERPLSVLLTGPTGTGKTYQGYALLRGARRRKAGTAMTDGADIHQVWIDRVWRPELERAEWRQQVLGRDPVRIINEGTHLRLHRPTPEWLAEHARFPGWLVVDDLACNHSLERVVDALLYLANERRAWRRPTLWTTNHGAESLRDHLGPPLTSRVLGGAVLHLTGEDRRLTQAATHAPLP